MRALSATNAVHSVQVSGVLDGAAALSLQVRFEALAAATGDVVVDLKDVSCIDGSGIAAIAFLFKRLVLRGRRLTVAATGQPLAMLRDLGIASQLGLSTRPARRRSLFWGVRATA
ncbi:MAG: STAS domain-containing protein [Nevskia sp.]|nr:STAS domain-containing protein [Nevskia sp.]